jgi:hypothetical protein
MERRYIARVVGVRPEIVETRTDYLVAVPRSRKAFLVTMNPMAEAVLGRGTAVAVVRKAREKDVPVFGGGRCIVYVFSDAWESETLVDRLHRSSPSRSSAGSCYRWERARGSRVRCGSYGSGSAG